MKKIEKVSLDAKLLTLSMFFIFFAIETSFNVQSIIIPIVLAILFFIFRKRKIVITKPIILLFVLLVIYTFSIAINAIRYSAFKEPLIQLLYYFTIFIWFALMTQSEYSKKDITFFINSYIVLAVFMSIILIFSNLFFKGYYFAITNLLGKTMEKNYFNAFLCLAPVLSYMKMLHTSKNKLIYIVATIVILISILYGNSRGALLASLVGIFLATVNFYKKEINMKKIIFSIILIFGLLIMIKPILSLIPDWMFNRYFVNSYADKSNEDRVARWENAFKGIKKQPILGFGPGIFGTLEKYRITSYGKAINPSTPAHNTFLDVLLDSGIIGLAVYLSFLCAIIIPLIKKNSGYIALVVSLVITIGILGAGKSVYYWNTLILFQIISVYYKNHEDVKEIIL